MEGGRNVKSFVCQNASMNYYQSEGADTLKNISVSLPDKGIVGVVGPSGSGKSSFLYMLAGFRRNFVRGSVTYKGIEINKYNEKQLAQIRRNEYGFIFQKHYLIPYLTAYENIMVSTIDRTSLEETSENIKLLGISALAGKRMKELSGGECQKVAIARALSNHPNVVFADEPTAALDRENAMITMGLLKKKSNCLIIMVTHDTSIFPFFDYKIGLMDGEITERVNL
jgi:putative ABC transport system ATP-binding protein